MPVRILHTVHAGRVLATEVWRLPDRTIRWRALPWHSHIAHIHRFGTRRTVCGHSLTKFRREHVCREWPEWLDVTCLTCRRGE